MSGAAGFLRSGGLLLALVASTVSVAAGPDISFTGPEVVKLDWSTRALNVSDLDGDGLNDLALINNDGARIELLYQRAEGAQDGSVAKKRLNLKRWDPLLEDARFKKESLATGFPMFDLVVGDLDGDGRVDLAYTAREVPLTIRSRNEAGNWTELREFKNFEALGWTRTLAIADLDGNGRSELLVIAADALRVFERNEQGMLDEPEVYPLTGDNPFNLLVDDFTGDGLKDVVYITSSGRQSLVLRERLSGGGFGPERHFIFTSPVREVGVLPRGEGKPALFFSVDSRSGGVEFFQLERQAGGRSKDEFGVARPEIFPIFKKGRQSPSFTLGDLDGDGMEDLLVSNPSAAELMLFLKANGRFQAPQVFPSFSEISSIASGRFYETGAEAVVVVSAAEKNVGVSRMDGDGRMSFPRQVLSGEGNPLVCEAVDMDGDGLSELALVTEAQGVMSLVLARPSDRNDPEQGWEVLSRLELEGVRRRPSAIAAMDIFGPGRSGMMVFVPREPPVLLASKADDPLALREVGKGSSLRESLLKDVARSQVSAFDVNRDGIKELVVGRSGYARALRVTEDGLEMVDQFNGRRSDEAISAIMPVYGDSGVTGILFYVASAGEFQILGRDVDGVFRYRTSVDVGSIELIQWMPLDDNPDGTEFLFAGEDRFWFLPAVAEEWRLAVVDSYETELEDVQYSHLAGADFNGNGEAELIAVDGKSHVVEILTRAEDGWRSRLYWRIFEQSMHYQGRTGGKLEPRQIVIADLTGDGKLDFVFLVHDRILFYPQE